ncbi:ATP-binding protein [Pseudotabrizicola sp.]|uniref:sensor histidine kinase n=1 Tax=Pseudotabrizicola sp. TaxID=2939647 RepID=UPI00271F496C|nr:ATP-binding protein [Pseudotabrizicola sp.]MDO8882331.1 ATP-binding protein [Pseudotabrizicola sp.]
MKSFLPFFAAVLAAVVVWVAAQHHALGVARQELDQTLLLTARAVEAEVDRLRALPDVAAEDMRIRSALTGTGSLHEANIYLETISKHAGADELFLLDASGLTIAASNWNREGSFVGHNYAFRPYFQKAIQQGHGKFYAIGVTTGVPGYFLSTRVAAGDAVGVLVVKLNLEPLQETWRAAGADVALADENGVVFLSARPDWQYRPLLPLDEATLQEIARTRAYEGATLAQSVVLSTDMHSGADVSGQGWIARVVSMPATGWQVIAARITGPLYRVAMGWAVLAALATLGIATGLMAWKQRRQIIALRLSQSQNLECMVKVRTSELAREIEARAQVESDLRATQEALIHTEKMAALGRMSAAIVHEISQPLAAMEATLAAAEMGLRKDDSATGLRLGTARGLIKRMQRITHHLKSFGRKEAGELSLIDMRAPLTSALEMVAPRARVVGVTYNLTISDSPVMVLAGAVRVEQILVNLLLNAIDAMADSEQRLIDVTVSAQDGEALLCVSDTGAGIADHDLPRVTEPFFSSKMSGAGLGLGLAICKAILADFNGTLEIASVKGQGTKVTVVLPLAMLAEVAAQ